MKNKDYKPEILKLIPNTLKEPIKQLKKEFKFVNMLKLNHTMIFSHNPGFEFNRCIVASNKELFKKPKKFKIKNINIDLEEVEIQLKWIIEEIPIFEIIEKEKKENNENSTD